ncbi:hypothetical protein Nepgr_029718 [Nepenthes gracilis]|uniref:Uncharacterized protein n=1 Tax=Nepenthes gracilis TaxID=150966 RepID=A0AAD3TD34_NEPGR|nr:hypothetical protein Nepgr_029718 [Nepenthes gracilis]
MHWSAGMMLRDDPLGRNAVGLLIDWVLSDVLLQLTPRMQECSGNEPLLPIVCQAFGILNYWSWSEGYLGGLPWMLLLILMLEIWCDIVSCCFSSRLLLLLFVFLRALQLKVPMSCQMLQPTKCSGDLLLDKNFRLLELFLMDAVAGFAGSGSFANVVVGLVVLCGDAACCTAVLPCCRLQYMWLFVELQNAKHATVAHLYMIWSSVSDVASFGL